MCEFYGGQFCLFTHLLSPSHGVFPVKLIRLRRSLACHPRSGAKRSAAGSEATLTRQRPDTLSRASAPLRALGCLFWSLRRSSFGGLDPKREPVFRHAALTAASPHIRSSLAGSDHNPSCSRASGSGWRDHPVKRRVSAREIIHGHRPPGSGEAVAFSFAGMGSSHKAIVAVLERD